MSQASWRVLSQALRPSSRTAPILCVLGSSFAFAVAAAMVKSLTATIPSIEVVAFRSAVAVVALAPLLRRHGGWRVLRTSRPLGHAARTLCGFVGMHSAYYGYATLPIATVTALGFAMPLFLTLLSVLLLGERVGWRRGSAVLAGLLGVLIMVRPWNDGAGALPRGPVAYVVLGVLAWALAMLSIRRMGAMGERNLTIILWYSIGSAVLAAMLSVPLWVTPSAVELAVLVGVGVISAAAQLLMTEAYRSGETTLVAPFEYGAILYTTAMGALIWGELPDLWAMAGILVIVAAGLLVWNEARSPVQRR